MKKKIHPKLNLILFLNNINKNKILAKSTINTNKNIKINKLNFKIINTENFLENK